MDLESGFLNAPRQSERLPRLHRRRARRELHQGCRQARRFPVGAELHRPHPRGAAWPQASDPHDAQRLAHRGRRASARPDRAAVRRDRERDFRDQRAARQAGRHGAHHLGGTCHRDDPLASDGAASARVSRRQRRDHQRLHPDRHRRRPLRRWRAAGGAGGQGHDRRADRAGPRQVGRGARPPTSKAGPNR